MVNAIILLRFCFNILSLINTWINGKNRSITIGKICEMNQNGQMGLTIKKGQISQIGKRLDASRGVKMMKSVTIIGSEIRMVFANWARGSDESE